MPVTVTAADSHTVLKVDGRLKVDDVEELKGPYRTVRGAASLDLADLQSADRERVAFLRELVALGVEVRAASPYVELLLQSKP